jgi:hypothetical protein
MGADRVLGWIELLTGLFVKSLQISMLICVLRLIGLVVTVGGWYRCRVSSDHAA